MLEQSFTLHFLLWLKKLFMVYEESVIYNIILKLGNTIKNIFEKSFVHHLFVKETPYQKKYNNSLFYMLLDKLLNVIITPLKRIYGFFEQKSKDSVARCVFNAFHDRGYFKFEYICALLIGFMFIVPHGMWNNIYAVFVAILIGGLYFLVYLSGKRGFSLNPRGIPVSMVAFLMAILAGIAITPDHMDGIRISLFYVASIVFAYAVYGSISAKKVLVNFVTIIIGALTIMCLYAIYQNYVGVAIDVRLTDLTANAGMPGRVYSTVENPNNFAEIIVLFLPFVYAMILSSESKLSKTAFVAVLGVCVAALAMTYSRSCYIAFAIATLVFVIMYDWRLLIPLAILAIICVPFLPESIMNRIFTIGSLTDSSNSYRTNVWEGVIRLVKDNGIYGIGIGPAAFSTIYPRYASARAMIASHSHMLYFEIFVELGIVGFLGFMAYMYSCLKKGFSNVNNSDKTIRCMIIAAISAFAGISFTACAEYIWFYPRVMFAFWTVLGILLASAKMARKNKIDR